MLAEILSVTLKNRYGYLSQSIVSRVEKWVALLRVSKNKRVERLDRYGGSKIRRVHRVLMRMSDHDYDKRNSFFNA